MAHSDDYTHIWNDGGLTMTEIGRALGNASRTINVLAVASNINKWAKYKPERSAVARKLTNAERASNNYGIVNIPRYIRVATMLSDVRNDRFTNAENISTFDLILDAWDYGKPRLSSGDRARMLDFAGDTAPQGYDSLAGRPIGTATAATFDKNPTSGAVYMRWETFGDTTNINNLFLKDFKINATQFSNCYLCLCVYNASTQYYFTLTGSIDDIATAIKVSQIGEYSANFKTSQLPVGTYEAFCFISDTVIPFSTTFTTTGNYFPVNFSKSSIQIVQPAINISIINFECYREALTQPIHGTFDIVNGDGNAYSLSDAKVRFRNADGTTLYETTVLTARNIQPNSTIRVSDSIWAAASIVSSYGLRNARDAHLIFTVNSTVTVQQIVTITIGLPRI